MSQSCADPKNNECAQQAIEVTIQRLIGSGMDPKTENNPYLGFIYTSFQERATKVRHHPCMWASTGGVCIRSASAWGLLGQGQLVLVCTVLGN